MSGCSTLVYEKMGHVALVTLSRPQALNALSIKMRDELYEILTAIRDDDEVRVVLFRGSGDKAFCAGADLKEFLTAPSPVKARDIRFARDLWGLLLTLPQPLIAALHGLVLGSGMEIALCCDLKIASIDAKFGLPETDLGIIPAAGGTQTLPRTIGRGKALEMLLTGRWLDAYEAYQAGLVHLLVTRHQLWDISRDVAFQIASYDPKAVQYTKQAVRRGMDLPLAEGLMVENILARRLWREGRPNIYESVE